MIDISKTFPGKDSDIERLTIAGSFWATAVIGEWFIAKMETVNNYTNMPHEQNNDTRIVSFDITRGDLKKLLK